MPNDEERRILNPNRYVTPPPHSDCTFEPLNENEGEHSQGQTTVASEGVKSANIEDAQDIDNSEGGESLTHPQEDDHQNIVDTQP
ncbi:hypothetical protein Tco_0836053, partial [Tanacetum coccineum]